MLPKLRLDFVDFGGTNKLDNYFYRALSKDFTIEISDRPDLLIFQDGGYVNRLYTCKKLFVTGESDLPDWSVADYAISCHFLDDPRHLRLPFYVWGGMASARDLIKSETRTQEILSAKRTGCSAVVSNANVKRSRERTEFFLKLFQKLEVQSAGRFMNNVGFISPGGPAKLDFIKKFKLNFSYENKDIPGYTTEKLTDAMLAGCIPIYWGNSSVTKEFNSKSFLFRNDFDSDEQFIQYIIDFDNNHAQYEKMLLEPNFHNNTPNLMFSEERVRAFLREIIDSQVPLVSRKYHFSIGRWIAVKRNHFVS